MTENNVSGWTTDTLGVHLERLLEEKLATVHQVLEERDRRYEQRFYAQEQAIGKADTATEKRFESVNEFRATLTDQAAGFLPRAEYDRAHIDLANRLDEVVRALTDKFEQAVKTLEGQLIVLRQQIAAIESVVK